MSRRIASILVVLAVVGMAVVLMAVKVQASASRTPKEARAALAGGWFSGDETQNVYMTFDGKNAAQVGLFSPKNEFRLFMGGGTITYVVSDSGTITFSGDATGTAEFEKDGTLNLKLGLRGPNPGEYYQVSNILRKVSEFKQGLMPTPSMMPK